MATRRDADVAGPTSAEAQDQDAPSLALHEKRPGEYVLTEDDNADGWLATDLLVDVTR